MIRSFACKETEKIWLEKPSRHFPPDVIVRAVRKLTMLDAAHSLNDLRLPPSNYLEALKGDRKGQHSIRINKKWRICFYWLDSDACEVEITDYH